MSPKQELELLDACRILFPSAEVNLQFLSYIQQEGLKNAYRTRAWEYHPDACPVDEDRLVRAELFRRSTEAYKLLSSYLKNRKPVITIRKVPQRPKPVFVHVEKAGKVEGEHYYEGPFPAIELKLGLFLYYSRAVSYQAVVRAMMWQRGLRPPIGEYARRWGWLDEHDVKTIVAATEIVGSFGERALALGLLSQSQLNIILLHQRSCQQPIGRYFVEQGLLSELMLRHYLREMEKHNKQVRDERLTVDR